MPYLILPLPQLYCLFFRHIFVAHVNSAVRLYVHVCVADHLRRLAVYEVVVPKRVDDHSSTLSRVLGRQKRSSGSDHYSDDDADRIYELTAFNRQMSLRLTSSPISLVSPSFVVQHMTDNETWLQLDANSSAAHDRWRCFREGHVDGHPRSIVVLSTCSHLVSLTVLCCKSK